MEENDLLREKGVALLKTIKAGLQSLHEKLPQTMLFWSSLLERKEWTGTIAPEEVGLARRRNCKAVSQFLVLLGGFCIKHPDITLW